MKLSVAKVMSMRPFALTDGQGHGGRLESNNARAAVERKVSFLRFRISKVVIFFLHILNS